MGRRLSEAIWRFAYASVIGTSHTQTATPCQDASLCSLFETDRGEAILIAVAADGAGSASHAAQGAQLACTQLFECAHATLRGATSLAEIDRAIVQDWIEQVRRCIDDAAERADTHSRAFACTLLVALVGQGRAVFAQVGDGAMVVVAADSPADAPAEAPAEYQWVFWPERGDYANMTRFITDGDYADHLQFESRASDIIEVALFTDGLQHLALQYEPPVAFAPFFNGLFPPVRRIAPEQGPALSKSLAAFLNSPKVNARTEDDKTLILATRMGERQVHE